MAHTQNILVVEDHEITYLAAQKLFAKHGYNVDLAMDGMEAMEKLLNNSYHVVVTDLAMPNVTGQELIKAIRRNKYNKTRILVVTSTYDEATVKETFDIGADDFIPKPYQAKELLARVQKLLSQSN